MHLEFISSSCEGDFSSFFLGEHAVQHGFGPFLIGLLHFTPVHVCVSDIDSKQTIMMAFATIGSLCIGTTIYFSLSLTHSLPLFRLSCVRALTHNRFSSRRAAQ